MDPVWRRKVAALVVDEAHTILEWGTTFRPDILRLSDLVDQLGASVPVCALSATLPNDALMHVFQVLRLAGKRSVGLDVTARRVEHFYDVLPFHFPAGSFYDTFLHLLPPSLSSLLARLAGQAAGTDDRGAFGADASPSALPKAVVFLRTKAECRAACALWRLLLPLHLRSSVAVFTGALTQRQRSRTLERFRTGTDLRIVFATEAFGMGCDIAGIDISLQYGDPSNLMSLAQHWGRAGRGTTRRGSVRCIWLTSSDTFGPPPLLVEASTNSALSTETTPQVVPTDWRYKPIVTSKKAREHRAALARRDPFLLEIAYCAHPERPAMAIPTELGELRQTRSSPSCLALRVVQRVRPSLSSWLASVGCQWTRLTTGSACQPAHECCGSCSRSQGTRRVLSVSSLSSGSASSASAPTPPDQLRMVYQALKQLIAQQKVLSTPTQPVSATEKAGLEETLLAWRKAYVRATPSWRLATATELLPNPSIKVLLQASPAIRARLRSPSLPAADWQSLLGLAPLRLGSTELTALLSVMHQWDKDAQQRRVGQEEAPVPSKRAKVAAGIVAPDSQPRRPFGPRSPQPAIGTTSVRTFYSREMTVEAGQENIQGRNKIRRARPDQGYHRKLAGLR